MNKTFLIIFYLAVVLQMSACSSMEFSKTGGRELQIKRLWARRTIESDKLSGKTLFQMAPLISESSIFVGNGFDRFESFEKSSGNLLWSTPITKGVHSGAAIDKNRVYFGSGGGKFYALNRWNGKIEWTYPIKVEGLATPLTYKDKVFVLTGDNSLLCFSASNGKLLWRYQRSEVSSFTVRGGARPVVIGNVLYAGFSDGYLVALNNSNGSLIWEKKLSDGIKFQDIDANLVVHKDKIYVSNYGDSFYSIQPTNGKIIWKADFGSYNEPLIVENRIYLSSSLGELVSLDLNTGKVIWKKELRGGLATGLVSLNQMFIYGESTGALIVTDSQSGETVGSYTTGMGILAPLRVDKKKGELYVISNGGVLYVFKINWSKVQNKLPWPI